MRLGRPTLGRSWGGVCEPWAPGTLCAVTPGLHSPHTPLPWAYVPGLFSPNTNKSQKHRGDFCPWATDSEPRWRGDHGSAGTGARLAHCYTLSAEHGPARVAAHTHLADGPARAPRPPRAASWSPHRALSRGCYKPHGERSRVS